MVKYVVIIAVLIIMLYANSIRGGFIADDVPSIVNNPEITNLWACTKISDIVNFVIYKFAALNTWPYHLFNISLHVINSILVLVFLLGFFGVVPSFFGAFLFASHPVQTEAVSWISGKSYLLLCAFLISSFLLYKKAASSDIRKIKFTPFRFGMLYILSILLYVLALFTAWQAVLYPGMIILFDVTYNRWREKIKLWVPFVFITVIWLVIKSYLINARITSLTADMGGSGLSNPLYNISFSLFEHAKLVFWPIKLTIYHEPLSCSLRVLAVQIFLLMVAVCFSPWLFKKAKPIFFALGLYALFLGTTYSPVMISWLLAERYLYIPLISFCMLAAFFLEKYFSKGKIKEAALVFLIILIGACSVRTIYRNEDWKDRALLWRATLRVSPLSPRSHINMGDVYRKEKNYEEAIREFKTAIKLGHNYAEAYFNLAETYQEMGRMNEAKANFEKAVFLKPELKKYLSQ